MKRLVFWMTALLIALMWAMMAQAQDVKQEVTQTVRG